MRSSPTQVRGSFALIRKGTGAVSGVATLAGAGSALTPAQMLETCHLHKIPAEMIRSGEIAAQLELDKLEGAALPCERIGHFSCAHFMQLPITHR